MKNARSQTTETSAPISAYATAVTTALCFVVPQIAGLLMLAVVVMMGGCNG